MVENRPHVPLELLERKARELAVHLNTVVDPPARFLLVLWTTPDPGGWLTFISNGYRPDVIAMLVEFVGRQAPIAGGPRELRGRALHRIVTDADDLWDDLSDAESEVWREAADQFAAVVAALPITDEGGDNVDRPDAGEVADERSTGDGGEVADRGGSA